MTFKKINTLALLVAVSAFCSPVDAGLGSNIKGFFSKNTITPAEAAARLEWVVKSMEEVKKASVHHQAYMTKLATFTAAHARVMNDHQAQVRALSAQIQKASKDIQTVVDGEILKIQNQSQSISQAQQDTDGGLKMWKAIDGAMSWLVKGGTDIVLNTPDTPLNSVANYVKGLAQGSIAVQEKNKASLEKLKQDLAAEIDVLKNLSADSANRSIANRNPTLKKALDDIKTLTKSMDDLNKELTSLLIDEEKDLKNYAQASASELDKILGVPARDGRPAIPGTLSVMLAAARCPNVTSFAQAAKIRQNQSLEPSEALENCKYLYIDILKKDKNAACHSLGSTSTNDQLADCINVLKK